METSDMYDLLENCGESLPPSSRGGGGVVQPRKTSDVLVVGRSHEFVEDEKRFRIPVFCSYCDGMLQRESFVQHVTSLCDIHDYMHVTGMLHVLKCDTCMHHTCDMLHDSLYSLPVMVGPPPPPPPLSAAMTEPTEIA